MELNAAATALAMPQNSAMPVIDKALKSPCVTRKKVPVRASAMAAYSLPDGQRRVRMAIHTAIIAGAVYCITVAVAVLDSLMAAK